MRPYVARSNKKKEMIFDILAQDLIIKFNNKNKPNSKWSCELK